MPEKAKYQYFRAEILFVHTYRLNTHAGFRSSLIDALAKENRERTHLQNELKHHLRCDMALLANEQRIYWTYRRVQLLSHLTWGKKKRKYQEKKRHYHDLLRRCRRLRKEMKIS